MAFGEWQALAYTGDVLQIILILFYLGKCVRHPNKVMQRAPSKYRRLKASYSCPGLGAKIVVHDLRIGFALLG